MCFCTQRMLGLAVESFQSIILRYGVTDRDVTMCVTESGRQDGHAWVPQQHVARHRNAACNCPVRLDP